MKIRKYQENDLIEIAKLIQKTFIKFNKNDNQEEAAQKYVNFYSTEKENLISLKENFQSTPIFLIAIENNQIIGIIRGKQNKLINLFVDGSHHKKGIGKNLIKSFEQEAKNLGSEKIKVKASLYAIPFYQKMGYTKTTGIRNFHNLKVQPMQKKL